MLEHAHVENLRAWIEVDEGHRPSVTHAVARLIDELETARRERDAALVALGLRPPWR